MATADVPLRRGAAARAGQPYDEAEDRQVRQMVESRIERESNAFYATGRMWDEGVIDPRDTRTVLTIALSAAIGNVVRGADCYACSG